MGCRTAFAMVLMAHKLVLGLTLVTGLVLGAGVPALANPGAQAAKGPHAAKASANKDKASAAKAPGQSGAKPTGKASTAQSNAKPNAKPNAKSANKSSTNAKRAKAVAAVGAAGAVAAVAARPSMGQTYGLHQTPDPLDLKSSVALVLDRNTNEVLFSKNAQAVLPIASITKLMTSMVVFEHHQNLDEVLTVTQDDVDTEKHSGSRLAVGSRLTR